MERQADEVKRLRSCINDLLSVLALSATWSGDELSEIAGTLLDVLLHMLRLDFAYVRLTDGIDGSPIELVRLADQRGPAVQPGEVGQALNRWLTAELFTLPSVITNPVGRGELSIARFGLGLEDEVGVVVAGSRRADFPTEIETLLVRVAANQTAIGLQEARRRRDQNRATEELERRVAERTADLRRVNEQLRAENAERKRAEDALQRSEAYLAEAQRISHTGSFGWHVSSGELFWSDETYRIAGVDRATRPTVEQVLQRIHPEDVVFVQETLDRASRGGTDLDFEHRFLMPDGSVTYVHVVAHAVRDERGDLAYVGAVTDVTAPKRLQQALERAFQDMQALKDQHRLVIDTIPGLVWSTLPDGHADFLNQRWLDYTGLSLEEARGWGWRAGFHPEDCAILDGWSASLAAGEPFEAEARMRRADGQYFWFLIRSVPLRDELGNIVRWYGTNTDIDDRKQAEDALRRSGAYLAEAQRLSHTGSWARNILTGEVFWSQEMFRMFAYDPGMQITFEKIIQERVHPEDVFLCVHTGETAIREKTDLEYENRIVLPDGSIRFHHAVAHPVVNAAGEVVELVGITMDVTEQHTARTAREAALDDVKKSEDRLRQAIDTIPAHIGSSQPDGSVDYINQRQRDYLGLSLAEAQSWGWTAVLHPEDRAGFVEKWRTPLATGEPWEAEARWRRADGEYRWFHVRSVALRDESGNIVRWYAVSTDIDDRKRAEEQLPPTKYSIDHSADYAFWAAPDARLVFVSDADCNALGYTRDELLKLTMHDINPDFPSEAWEDHWKGLRASQSLCLESKLRRKNGQIFSVELSLNYLLYNGQEYGFCFARDITQRQQRDEEMQRLTTRVLQLQDEERRRIARDLHDVTAQDLGAVAVNLALLRRLVTDLKPEAQNIVTESASLAEAVLQQIRTLSYLLHPPLLDQVGLASALRWYVKGFTKRSGIHVDIEISRDIGRPSLDIETALFRIVQESLTNVHRHSGSGSATIRLVRAGERMALHVKDQGSGIIDAATGAIADHVQSLGLGILGMRQQLRQFGGQLEIKTSHHGTEIIATVPLTSAPTGQRTRGSVRENDDGKYPTGGRSRDHAARVAWSP